MKEIFSMQIPCAWMAFIPPDQTNAATWYNLFELREVSVSKFDDRSFAQVVWTNGDKSKFVGDRADAFIDEFAQFTVYLEGKKEGDRHLTT